MSAEAEQVHYFSNGSEGDGWMSRWCFRCAHDHNFHSDDGPQKDPCMVMLALYVGEANGALIGTAVPVEIGGKTFEHIDWSCINFERCACDNGPDDPGVESKPTPDPNQGSLFDDDVLMPGVWRDVVLDELGPVAAHPSHGSTQ